MIRYYGLVLVPDGIDEDDIYATAAALLYPHMCNEKEPSHDYKFDWFLQPDDLAEGEEERAQYVWKSHDVIEEFPELEIEAILTPDGEWHYSESGLWDENEWVLNARQLLLEHNKCSALKHLFHI